MRYAVTTAFSTITIRRKPFLIQNHLLLANTATERPVLDLDSVLPMLSRRRDAKALHLVEKRSAL